MCIDSTYDNKKNNIQITKIILFSVHKYDSFTKNEITQNLFVQSRLLIFHLLCIQYSTSTRSTFTNVWHFSLNIQSNNLTRCAQKRKTISTCFRISTQFYSIWTVKWNMSWVWSSQTCVSTPFCIQNLLIIVFDVLRSQKELATNTQWMTLLLLFSNQLEFYCFLFFLFRLKIVCLIFQFKYLRIFGNDYVQTNWAN